MNYRLIFSVLKNYSQDIFENSRDFFFDVDTIENFISSKIDKNKIICVLENVSILTALVQLGYNKENMFFICDDQQKKMLANLLGIDDKNVFDSLDVSKEIFKNYDNVYILSSFYYQDEIAECFRDIKNGILLNMHPVSYCDSQINFESIKDYAIFDAKKNVFKRKVKAGSILREVVNLLEEKERHSFLNYIINNHDFKINKYLMCIDEDMKTELVDKGFARTQTWGHKFKFDDRNIFYCTQYGYRNAGILCNEIKRILKLVLNHETIFIEPKIN